MERKIGIIVPFEVKKQRGIDRTVRAILLFAKRILDKYSTLSMYGFDDAAMIFLEQIAEGEKQSKDIRKHIEFTVKLMLHHQNRNRLANDIINENTAFQKSITNHVMVNLNRLLSVDKRVYSELNQISRNNVQIKEAYDKIVKLENHEKKLVFQVQNQEIRKPKSLTRSFYQMFQKLMQQNQVKLSSQLFKESVARQQFKQNLNKLLELQTLRTDVERHEFLHVMKYGTLDERREAMDVLRSAVVEVNQTLVKKEKKHALYTQKEELLFITENGKQNLPVKERLKHTMKEIMADTAFLEETKNQHFWTGVSSRHTHFIQNRFMNNSQYVQGEQKLLIPESNRQEERQLKIAQLHRQEERQLQVAQNHKQEKEVTKLSQLLKEQQIIQAEDHKLFEEIKTRLTRQDQLVTKVMKEQEIQKKQGSPATISGAITKHLKSEIHLDRMRYGVE